MIIRRFCVNRSVAAVAAPFYAIFVLASCPLLPAAEKAPPPKASPDDAPKEARTEGQGDPFPDPYSGPPDFIAPAMGVMSGGYGRDRDALSKAMELSFEPAFYTLNDLCGYSKPEPRSAALVTKALEKEKQGEYREALEIYQKVINEFPEDLHRVSKYGIFVPVSQYCQRRILRFPAKDLQFYREKHDAKAKEAYEQAVAKHSLEGLAEIRDRMMATSYGGRAMLALGDAALDRGHYLEALEYYETVRDFFPDKDLHTSELGLKIEYCRKMLRQAGASGGKKLEGGGALSAEDRGRLQRLAAEAKPEEEAYHSQLASAPNISADDYTLMPPTDDPLGLKPPVWEDTLPNSQNDFYIYSHPVITKNSVIYRYKNVVYCRSLLTGELRWKNDMGGRVVWQNWMTRQFHQEDVLVQDGLVFTPIYKRGPTLVALDEVTGQLRWAIGPMTASTPEEAKMRFECAPAGGPGAVYAGYILDDIEGDTHVDSEYGVIALESKTGRILWRRPICRYRPGLFSAGMAARYRNRIRSFVSPPLYHEGTVYYCTNMGAVAAIDALSGRVRWAMRYPYYAFITDIHDFTRQFGEGGGPVQYTRYLVYAPHPMVWYAQRPLLIGEKLYVLPIDSPFMFCISRRDGKVLWTQGKGAGGRPIPPHNHPVRPGTGGPAHLLGTLKSGELVVTYSNRWHPGPVHLLDPNTGKVVWESDDIAIRDTQPTLKYRYGDNNIRTFCLGSDGWTWQNSARPFITSDEKLYITSCTYWGYPIFGWSSHLTELSIPEKKILQRRRFLSGELLATCSVTIHEDAPNRLKLLNDLPHKDERIKQEIKMVEEMTQDTDPENEHGPFLPFSRVTAERYGAKFELRISPRTIGMVYDREAVKRALAGREDPEGLFGRAELALGESRLEEAAKLFERCLGRASAQDLDFRAAINQQLYQVHKRLAQGGVRAGDLEREMANCVGMSRTVGTLGDEIETIFALAEAHERRGDFGTAERMLRMAIKVYGQYEYPLPSALGSGSVQLMDAALGVLGRGSEMVKGTMYREEMGRSFELLKKGLPLYFSALSPLEKDLTVRVGDHAAERLLRLSGKSAEVGKRMEEAARLALEGKGEEERLQGLWEYPGTAAGQAVLEELFRKAAGEKGAEWRRRMWRLADVARVAGLKVPEAYRARVSAPEKAAETGLEGPFEEREEGIETKEGTAWLVLDMKGDKGKAAGKMFLGGKVQKRFDSKFLLSCVDMGSGKTIWKGKEEWGDRVTEEISLRGKGNEAGFFEAIVYGDVVVTHGMYDVLAFRMEDGKLKWRYQVPFDFEIREAVESGDILVLAGKDETIALYMGTEDPRGEVIWQEKEEGDLYVAPYFHGDRLVSVRKYPFNMTVRYRATGKLIGRLALPDLTMHEEHPLLKEGPREVPFARDGGRLVVSDGWYYIMVDVERMKVAWKRLIDNNDPTREPAMRFALGGEYFAVVKEDYDQKTIYMLSSGSGEVLWNTDPKVAGSPQPMHSMVIDGGKIYGIGVHPGQGYYFVARECGSGKQIYSREQKGYDSAPEVRLLPKLYGRAAVCLVRDRQEFEVSVFGVEKGDQVHRMKMKGVGNFGEHGRVSAGVQGGRIAFLSKDKLKLAAGKTAAR